MTRGVGESWDSAAQGKGEGAVSEEAMVSGWAAGLALFLGLGSFLLVSGSRAGSSWLV